VLLPIRSGFGVASRVPEASLFRLPAIRSLSEFLCADEAGDRVAEAGPTRGSVCWSSDL
jgi:hypothetical protein